MKKKKKKWLVSISSQDYDEFEITAKNKQEARKKAQRLMDKHCEYMEMEIDTITEAE